MNVALPRRVLPGVLAAPALAQDAWPSRPIRCIVPFPPGGGTDIAGRLAVRRMGEALGATIVVENRPGAGGAIGSLAVARSAPDGYTIGVATTSTHPVAPIFQRDLAYDPVADFAAITQIGTTPYVLIAGRAAPAVGLQELLAWLRARPGQISYASVGVSTLGYLLARQFEQLTGLSLNHVPYRGSSQVYPDLLNGTVALLLDNPPASAAMVRDGALTAYAVTRPSNLLPGVPTFAQAGVPGFDAAFWYGLVAPAGLPPAMATRMQRALASQAEPLRAELRATDIEPVISSPEQFARAIATDATDWRALATRLDIRPE